MIDTNMHLFLPSLDTPGCPTPGMSQTGQKYRAIMRFPNRPWLRHYTFFPEHGIYRHQRGRGILKGQTCQRATIRCISQFLS